MKQREIKFRGKRIDNGEWVFGSLIKQSLVYGSRFFILEYSNDEELPDVKYHIDPNTIGQLLGLNDVDGKEIYDGDLYRHEEEHDLGDTRIYFQCVYVKEIAGYCFLSPEEMDDYNTLEGNDLQVFVNDLNTTDADDCKRIKIIGNIHDNPELFS